MRTASNRSAHGQLAVSMRVVSRRSAHGQCERGSQTCVLSGRRPVRMEVRDTAQMACCLQGPGGEGGHTSAQTFLHGARRLVPRRVWAEPTAGGFVAGVALPGTQASTGIHQHPRADTGAHIDTEDAHAQLARSSFP